MMPNPLRVTIVTRSLSMGGTQRHIVKLCQELAEKDISVSLCLFINDEPRDLVNELPPQTKLYIFPHRRHDLRTVFWLAKIVRAEKSQLVHSFSWHADFYASFLKILIPGLVVIASERGDRGFKGFYRLAYNWTDRVIVFRLVDGFCANSQFGKRLLVAYGCKQKQIWVIPNGVNLARIDSYNIAPVRNLYNWPSSSTVGCIVSRLVDYKGIDVFIRCVKSCHSDIRFIIIGDGPEKEHLTSLVAELSLEDRVILVGQLNPAIPYIKGADICILATREETEHCSNSILEYMACAKPVVAMDVAGNSELIASGVTGCLIEPQRVESISAVLDQLVSNKGLVKQMGLAGRKRIEEFFQMRGVAEKFVLLWKYFLLNNDPVER